MPFLSERDRATLRERFDTALVEPVTLSLFVAPVSRLHIPGRQPSMDDEARKLLEEVVGLSDKLTLEVHDVSAEPDVAQQHGVTKTPSTLLSREGSGQVRFIGLPAGYEFSVLIQDLVDVSSGDLGLSEQTHAALADLSEPVHIQVFSTPT